MGFALGWRSIRGCSVSAVGAMLAVWAVVGVAAALAGHPALTHASAPRTIERGAERAAIRVRVTPPAPQGKRPSARRATGAGHTRPHGAEAPPRPAGRLPRERLRREA